MMWNACEMTFLVGAFVTAEFRISFEHHTLDIICETAGRVIILLARQNIQRFRAIAGAAERGAPTARFRILKTVVLL